MILDIIKTIKKSVNTIVGKKLIYRQWHLVTPVLYATTTKNARKKGVGIYIPAQ